MLGRYKGPIILRDDPIVPRNLRHKLYPKYRSIYGRLLVDHKVTIETEIAEIRARHEARREYNRARAAARRARLKQGLTDVSVDHRALDESDA